MYLDVFEYLSHQTIYMIKILKTIKIYFFTSKKVKVKKISIKYFFNFFFLFICFK